MTPLEYLAVAACVLLAMFVGHKWGAWEAEARRTEVYPPLTMEDDDPTGGHQ